MSALFGYGVPIDKVPQKVAEIARHYRQSASGSRHDYPDADGRGHVYGRRGDSV
ncbi:MAG: hypothetical protein ACLUI3_03435 [Christensenellales bacterium]